MQQHVVDERSMFWKAGMKDYKHGVGNLRNGELVFGTSNLLKVLYKSARVICSSSARDDIIDAIEAEPNP